MVRRASWDVTGALAYRGKEEGAECTEQVTEEGPVCGPVANGTQGKLKEPRTKGRAVGAAGRVRGRTHLPSRYYLHYTSLLSLQQKRLACINYTK